MSAQGKRNPLKRGKDQIQDTALLDAVRERMPQLPLDHAFENGLQEELRGFYEGWMETVGSVASGTRSEEHTSELQLQMRNSNAVFCLKKKNHHIKLTIQRRKI